MIFQAHKGVSTENPENTMPAFIAAIEQGYKVIELDVSVTKDLQFVLLHDASINRTARYENGMPIAELVNMNDITYQEALEYDFGIWFAKKFKGTRIPLLEEVLKLAKGNGVKLKIDNKYQSFTEAQRSAFFELLKSYEDVACLTCNCVEELKAVSQIFTKMEFHYDGPVTGQNLQIIGEILQKDRLTIWLPHKNPNTAWVQVAFADAALADMIKPYARLGVWILSNKEQLDEAEKLGTDIIETDGQIKPVQNEGMRADMHTHSENSHDSQCKIEEMYHMQLQKGTEIFAVTDHLDTTSVNDYDVFTPIKTSNAMVKALNQKYGSSILAGVEIGEAFWNPEAYEIARNLVDYDVILGSVHVVKHEVLPMPYVCIDFSKLEKPLIIDYLNAYFDDMLTMLDMIDFDILAHLTCPLRHVNGRCKRNIDTSHFEEKIEKILRLIIQRGIALEVNTGTMEMMKDVMPSSDILKKYRDMGGYLITLGSDAHSKERGSIHFSEAIGKLKEIGFKNIFYYENRKAYPITI